MTHHWTYTDFDKLREHPAESGFYSIIYTDSYKNITFASASNICISQTESSSVHQGHSEFTIDECAPELFNMKVG